MPYKRDFFEIFRDKERANKLDFMFAYFKQERERINSVGAEAYIEIERRSFSKAEYELMMTTEYWQKRREPLEVPKIDDKSRMEDQSDSVVVDFANKFIGGGVLTYGTTQEEILFLTHPQSLVSIILCECL